MRFAFLIMADHEVDSSVERSSICDGQFSIISVNDLSGAIKVAKELKAKGVGCIELCGAFTPEMCYAIIDATEGEIPIGYVTHLEKQDELFRKTFI